MRSAILVIALTFLLYEWGGHRVSGGASAVWLPEVAFASATPSNAPASPDRVDFQSQIKPILQTKCMPCHFSGGVMYERLPFDRPETIRHLGTKLFTRITNEEHRRLIRDFLGQVP